MIHKISNRIVRTVTGENVNDLLIKKAFNTKSLDALAQFVKPLHIVELAEAFTASENSNQLADYLNAYGSDKANHHNYHLLYASIFDRHAPFTLFEIGLGTNNPNIPSSMGIEGKPGASLRAFRDWAPQADVFGADIDRDILFTEERINTFYLDQTRPQTFSTNHLPGKLNIVIDDGLHTPEANFNSLKYFLPRTTHYIVEDILEAHLPYWQLLPQLMPDYQFKMYRATGKSAVYICHITK